MSVSWTNSLFVLTPGTTIRLADGTRASEGRVEIFHVGTFGGEESGQWGTICDDQWDLRDASVVCRMLNYSGVLAAPSYGAYGEGSGQIWLDSLLCTGNESSIEECPHGGWGNHDCSHFEDAGVICQTNDSVLPTFGMCFIEPYKRKFKCLSFGVVIYLPFYY